MNIGNFFWELANITVFNPQMWLDMAIVLGPVFAAFAVFVWYQMKHPTAECELSEEGTE
jgi:hypothetical protein